MIKTAKILALFLIILSGTTGRTQNLVPNSTFDVYYIEHTPGGICDSFATITSWFSPTKIGTPDFAFSINNLICPTAGFTNSFGSMTPYADGGYAHLGTYTHNWLWDSREYIQTRLHDTLKKDQRYCLSFFLCLTDSSDYVADMIGAYFSIDSIYIDTSSILPYIPQIENCTKCFYETKKKWQRFSGSFIAEGGERYITIGNFSPDSLTNIKWIPDGGNYPNGICSYFIDSITFIECPNIPPPPPPPPPPPVVKKENKVYIPNIFSPNGDGQNELFFIRGENIESYYLKVYNRWGNVVFETRNKDKGWDGKHKGKQCPSGAYVYQGVVWYKDGEAKEVKGSVTIVR